MFGWFKKARNPKLPLKIQEVNNQKGPLQIHFETFKPWYSSNGNQVGQMGCLGNVYVSMSSNKGEQLKKKAICHNHTLFKPSPSNIIPNLVMTVCLDEINPVEDSMVLALLYNDGHIECIRFIGTGEVERLPLENVTFPLSIEKTPEYLPAIACFENGDTLGESIKLLRR